MTFYEEVGGAALIQKVHKVFYDKIYSHPWIGKYFIGLEQSVIEIQQNDFMGQSFGGPAFYLGKLPGPAHKHMFINEELFNLRRTLLEEALIECKVSEEHRQKWLKIDSAFKNGIVKTSVSNCEKRYFTDEIVSFENILERKVS